MHCPTAWGQWAVQFLQCTASLPGGSGQCNSCNTLPHCLGAVGSGPPSIHGLTAWGQWAVDLLQYTAALPGGSGQWTSFNALLHCLGAVGSGPPATHCLTAWGQWAVDFLQCTAPLPGGSGQCNSCNTRPHCLGAVQLLQCIASLPSGSRQWNSCNALRHCLGAVGSATPAMHYLTALGQWASELLQHTAAPPWGQRAVELLQLCCRVLCGFVSLVWWSCLLRRALWRCPLPWALRFPALPLVVFPRAVCSVLCVFCRGLLVRAVVRHCAMCCVRPRMSYCAFAVVTALCGVLLRCAGALALCCSCGLHCFRRLVLWCVAVCCAFFYAVLWCWVCLPAGVFWWRVSMLVSLSGCVACFPVVGVVCCGALLPCVLFCGALLLCEVVLACPAVVLWCCFCFLFLFSFRKLLRKPLKIFLPPFFLEMK